MHIVSIPYTKLYDGKKQKKKTKIESNGKDKRHAFFEKYSPHVSVSIHAECPSLGDIDLRKIKFFHQKDWIEHHNYHKNIGHIFFCQNGHY